MEKNQASFLSALLSDSMAKTIACTVCGMDVGIIFNNTIMISSELVCSDKCFMKMAEDLERQLKIQSLKA